MTGDYVRLCVGAALWWCIGGGVALAQQPPQVRTPELVAAGEVPPAVACAARLNEQSGRMVTDCSLEAAAKAPDKADQAVLDALGESKPIGPNDLTQAQLSLLPYPAPNELWPRPGKASLEAQAAWVKWLRARSDEGQSAAKRAYFPRSEAPVVWTMPFKGLPMGAPWMELVQVSKAGSLRVAVEEVQAAEGLAWPDPEVWVLAVTSRGDPEGGRVVAHSDDEANGLPLVELNDLAEGTYRIIVSSYRQEAGGWAKLRVVADGREVVGGQTVPFGGVAFWYGQVRRGERFMAGAYGNSGAVRHDTFLVLLPLGSEGEARYAASNNDLGLLPLVEAPQDMGEGLLLAGSFQAGSRPRVRVIRTRGAVAESASAATPGGGDADGDGLTAEVEALLGTCDSVEMAVAGACKAVHPIPWKWSPADTDNDGSTDYEEVYGIRRCFKKAPLPPLFSVPACVTGSGGRCTDRCSEGWFQAEMPLSAMDSPLPTRHDIYVELDWWSDRVPVRKPPLSKSQVDEILKAYGKEWSHNIPEGQGFRKGQPVLKLHLMEDDVVGLASQEAFAHIPAAGARYLFFNTFFNPNRRYTGIFYYILLKDTGSGQSDVGGRAAIVGVGNEEVAVTNLVHELGHLVGLQHNGTAGEPTNTPFYLSIMSYAYSHSLPPPMKWTGAVESCTGGKKCGAGLKCIGTKRQGAVCLPDCGLQDTGADAGRVYVRLSGGELPVAQGTQEATGVAETGYPEWFIPYYYCAARLEERGGERLARLLDPACPGGKCVQCIEGQCSIDWNRDGVFAAAPADVDGNGELTSIPLGDMDDAERIVELGRRGPYAMTKRNEAVFYLSFEGAGQENQLPYPVQVVGEAGGRVLDRTNRCDEKGGWRHCRDEWRGHALWFPGGGGTPGVEAKAREGYCVGMAEGTTLSLRVKPMDLSAAADEETLFDGGKLRLRMGSMERGGVRWVAEVNTGASQRRLVVEDPEGMGKWSRLTLVADVRSGLLELHVRRGSFHPVASIRGVKLSLGTVCRWSLGSGLGGQALWQGLLDDPIWVAGPVREM